MAKTTEASNELGGICRRDATSRPACGLDDAWRGGSTSPNDTGVPAPGPVSSVMMSSRPVSVPLARATVSP